MLRRFRRPSPRALAGLRWVAADAREVACIDAHPSGQVVAVASVAGAVARWQGRLERRRLIVLARRAALVGASAACALQVAALLDGQSGAGVWLLPAAVAAAACLAIGLTQRTSAGRAARMLDRDLHFGAKVTTALELESTGVSQQGLGALALADGRAALADSLAGTRVRLRPQRKESALLAALALALLALLLLPGTHGSAAASRRHVAGSPQAGAAGSSAPLPAPVGATLRGYKQTPVNTPPLAAIQAASQRAGGAGSGSSIYGGGIADKSSDTSSQPPSRTVGQAGSITGTQAASAAQSAGEGSGASGQGAVGSQGAGSAGANGVAGVAPIAGGTASPQSQPGAAPGTASSKGGSSQGGGGSSAPGSASAGRAGGRATPGGATAGGTHGARNLGSGVVPQLKAGTALPLQPGYESVKGSSGAKGESASSSSSGAGGASHSGRATGGAGAGGTGVAYVPPGSAGVAAIDRGLVLGYFSSFARVNASGW